MKIRKSLSITVASGLLATAFLCVSQAYSDIFDDLVHEASESQVDSKASEAALTFYDHQKKAQSGDVESQYLAGRYLLTREDFTEQLEKTHRAKAVKYFLMAAEKGHVLAQSALGECYLRGVGVPANVKESLKWYKKAAEQGRMEDQNMVGIIYASGDGVPRDDEEAVKWFRKSADQGFNLSQIDLGKCYAVGRGVKKDVVQAYHWFNLAATSPFSKKEGSKLRDYLAGEMTSEEITKAQRLSREWKPKVEGKPKDDWVTPDDAP